MDELRAAIADYATILLALIHVGALATTFFVKYKESIKKRLWPWQFTVAFISSTTVIMLVQVSADSLLVTTIAAGAQMLSVYLIPNRILQASEKVISSYKDALAVRMTDLTNAVAVSASVTLFARFLLSCMDKASLQEAQRLAEMHKTFFDQPLASPPDYEKFASVFQDDDAGTIAQKLQSFSEEELIEIHHTVGDLILKLIDGQQSDSD